MIFVRRRFRCSFALAKRGPSAKKDLKLGVEDIIGKTITSVVVTEHKHRTPKRQAYLIFSDETYTRDFAMLYFEGRITDRCRCIFLFLLCLSRLAYMVFEA